MHGCSDKGHFNGAVLRSMDDPMADSQRRKSISAPRHSATGKLGALVRHLPDHVEGVRAAGTAVCSSFAVR